MIYIEQRNYIIREFKPEDLDVVVNINKICLPENYPPSFFLEHYYENPKIFLVAEINGKVVGYNMCRLELGLSNIGEKLVRKGHVISIAVMAEFRRMGIGSKLLEEALKRLKGCGASEVYLEVRITNYPAIALYRKMGFRVIKIIEGYYRDGESAYLMVKEL